jgi:hypothetical protein
MGTAIATAAPPEWRWGGSPNTSGSFRQNEFSGSFRQNGFSGSFRQNDRSEDLGFVPPKRGVAFWSIEPTRMPEIASSRCALLATFV